MNGLSLVTLGKITCCECKFITVLPIELELYPIQNIELDLDNCSSEINLELDESTINLDIDLDDINIELDDTEINLDCGE